FDRRLLHRDSAPTFFDVGPSRRACRLRLQGHADAVTRGQSEGEQDRGRRQEPIGGLHSGMLPHRHPELIELRQIALIRSDLETVRVDVDDAEVIDLLEDVAGNPKLRMFTVIERGAATARDDVGDAVANRSVVDVVVPLEDEADAMPLEERMEDGLKRLHVRLNGMGANREDRLVEKRDDEPSRGLRTGEVGLEPAPLVALRVERLLSINR